MALLRPDDTRNRHCAQKSALRGTKLAKNMYWTSHRGGSIADTHSTHSCNGAMQRTGHAPAAPPLRAGLRHRAVPANHKDVNRITVNNNNNNNNNQINSAAHNKSVSPT
jgi:hypothetical protein